MKVRFKTLLASALLAGLAAQPAAAQQREAGAKGYPYLFVGLHGGAQVTFTNYNAGKLVTPIEALSVGGMFTPVVGARVNVSGHQAKGGFSRLGQTYDYKFVTADADLLLNLTNLFAPQRAHRLNAYLVGGAGATYAWDNDALPGTASATPDRALRVAWSDSRWLHNFRVGMLADWEVARAVGISLEVTANHLNDRFNSKLNAKGDWQLQAMLGVNFKIGRGRKARPAVAEPPAPQPAPAPVPERQVEPQPAPEVCESPATPAPAPAELRTEVHFLINSARVQPEGEARIAALAQWLKDHPEARVQLTGYADAGTGTAAVNRRISQRRVQAVARLLTEKHGIAAARISTDYKGDTEQPFTDNDANRVVIGLAR